MTVRTRSQGAHENGNGVNGSAATNGKSHNGVQTRSALDSQLSLMGFLHHTVAPLALMCAVPNLVIILWFTSAKCDGSYMKMIEHFYGKSPLVALLEMWKSSGGYSPEIGYILLGFAIWGLVLIKLLPGKTVYGPVTPKGNVPVYKDNGFTYFIVTLIAFFGLTYFFKTNYGVSSSIVYDRFGQVLNTLNLFSLVFCVILYFKGRFFPSTTDNGYTGNFVFDYYWGTELYPRFFDLDVKLFTNCRFGLMGWALLVCVHAVKSYEMHGFVDSMFVSVTLQLFYLAKFFWWEAGYMRTIDIMLDRAGFYICWGCLVFVPGLYASPSLFLVNQPVRLGPALTVAILLLGILSIAINYIADWQKQEVRAHDGNCQIWGKKAEIIRAKYVLPGTDTVKESILLVSGWWGVGRHFHYTPEILLAFFWTVPALFTKLMPYTYVIFLTGLLVHRTFRDDRKCREKYTTYWTEYCKRVPYKMVPGIF